MQNFDYINDLAVNRHYLNRNELDLITAVEESIINLIESNNNPIIWNDYINKWKEFQKYGIKKILDNTKGNFYRNQISNEMGWLTGDIIWGPETTIPELQEKLWTIWNVKLSNEALTHMKEASKWLDLSRE